MSQLIDLSHRLNEGMPSYPGLPEPHFRTFFTHEESEKRGAYAPGTSFEIALYEIGGNTGTYIDAPYHRHRQGHDLARLSLEKIAALAGIVIDAPEVGEIGQEAFEGAQLGGRAVLVRTGWSRWWGDPNYFRSGPYLGGAACRYLVEQGAALVGIDCANIDNMGDPRTGDRGDLSRPAHTTLLAAGIPIVEHLRGLEELPASGFRFFAVPPAIERGTSFPVRAFAVVE